MKNKAKSMLFRLLLASMLVIELIVVSTANPIGVNAEQKSYGESLTLNDNIKLNETSTFVKTGIYQEEVLFSKKKSTKIKYTIKCSRKESGDNYKVSYKVNYKYLSNPMVDSFDNIYDDYYWSLTQPEAFYTVFDYNTGKSLEKKNEFGVKVKDGNNWKYTYYPKQTIIVALQKNWYRNVKTISYSFSVIYPKNYKDVVVGIGFANHTSVPEEWTDNVDNRYWEGEVPYGKTSYYKNGKKTMSYIRLNK